MLLIFKDLKSCLSFLAFSRHSALDAESMVRQAHHDTLSLSKGWIPAGVYPVIDTGQERQNV
jgi:hypothetical protein